ncbi:MAG: hypothetical protein C0399_12460 [Syntrophus sp. (in: bacteria)]|nr:hypothetical protein [Syntrophus sp. (in: bacteria)]
MKLMKKDIRPNTQVTTFFALESMQLKKAKSGNNYLVLGLHDKTGRINGYLWEEAVEMADTLKEKTIVKVRGVADTHNGSITLRVDRVRKAEKDEVDLGDFLEVVPGGLGLWHEKLLRIVETLDDIHCKRLINAFLEDEGFLELFITSPGGLSVHHNYVGGLLEHTVSSMEMVSAMAERHPALIDRDQVITGAFLHDIGKTREIYWEIGREYTTEGKLFGHILIGTMMFQEKIAAMKNFPVDLANRLCHMIASHHGTLEHGSPVKPSTPEAITLHMMEAYDARINHLYRHMGNADPEKDWSPYDRILETEIYQKKYTGKDVRPIAVAA